MERSMRKQIAEQKKPLIGLDSKKTDRPTSYAMSTKFSGVLVIKVGSQRQVKPPLNPVQREYLAALGVSEEAFINPVGAVT